MWRDPGAPADSFYLVRPECTDVPKTRFKIKVRWLFVVFIFILTFSDTLLDFLDTHWFNLDKLSLRIIEVLCDVYNSKVYGVYLDHTCYGFSKVRINGRDLFICVGNL